VKKDVKRQNINYAEALGGKVCKRCGERVFECGMRKYCEVCSGILKAKPVVDPKWLVRDGM